MNAITLIKRFEGCRLKAYRDVVGVWTIGWGRTTNVKKGDTCTQEQADKWLDEEVAVFAKCVDNYVLTPISSKQRDALISFAYNVGCAALARSTLVKKINSGDFAGAANEFLKWDKAGGKKISGLSKRREAERELFISGIISRETIELKPQETAVPIPFLAAAVPALISALPEFAKIFSKQDVAERNTEALVKATETIMAATGSPNIQAATEAIQSDPDAAQKVNEALRANRAEIMDMLERMNTLEQGNIKAAREYQTQEPTIIGKWKFWHILAILVVVAAIAAMGYILAYSEDIQERTMVLQVLLLGGFGVVMQFAFGSSEGSKTKDLLKKD